MKKHIIFITIILTILCLSCGVIMERSRLLGTWEFDSVEYYVYDPVLDAIRTYEGVAKKNPTAINPIQNAFFGDTTRDTYVPYRIIFDNSGESNEGRIEVTKGIAPTATPTANPSPTSTDQTTDASSDPSSRIFYAPARITSYTSYIDKTNISYSVNNQDNSITVTVNHDGTPDNIIKGIWRKNLSFTNYWPMVDYKTLELLIKVEDVPGFDYFELELKNGKKIKAHAMKATFIRQ